jgi:hypothetical protein
MKFPQEINAVMEGEGDDLYPAYYDSLDDIATVGQRKMVAVYRLVRTVNVSAKTVLSIRKTRKEK